MGLEFGHHLGLSGAVSDLPLSPLIPHYGQLLSLQRTLGLRHLGEALTSDDAHLHILDGVFVSRRHRARERVGHQELQRISVLRPNAARLLRALQDVHARHPAALRRVLLYQLTELLQDHPQGKDAATAVALGVAPDEARALVHAARALPRFSSAQRAAAQALEDEWEHRRLHAADRLVRELPRAAEQDPWLGRRMRQIVAALRDTEEKLAAAARLEDEGDPEAAGELYLSAARLACDDPDALRGLVRTRQAGTDSPAAGLGPDSVTLTWPADPDVQMWRVIRLAAPDESPAVLADTADSCFEDRKPPLGSEIRYAVLPLRERLIDGPPIVSARFLAAPDVTDLRFTEGPNRLDATWLRPPGAAAVSVSLTGPDGRPAETVTHDGGFTARGLPPGTYRARVSCRYRTAAGREVRSPGIEARHTVRPWPDPVRSLAAAAKGGGVRFTWTGGAGADIRLVEWPGDAPEPGAAFLPSSRALPEPLAWPLVDGHPGVFSPPAGTARVTAVAVLGDRAVAGPSIRIEVPPPVTGFRATRTTGGLARVTFDWPAGTGRVAVFREQDGKHDVYPVTRSVFLREGLRIPVGPSAVRLSATAEARTAGTTVIATGAEVVLGADIAITYRIVPRPRRPLRRRTATVRVTLTCPDGEGVADLPEFVLVARGGARDPVRPAHPADGATVLQVSGEELRTAGAVERELPTGEHRPPFALRGFLLGGNATSVRLDEPSPATLVIR
ncbi:carboxypeptidase-like regulatory domain-containing protein [Streptomyces rimosus]|uniref:carboxypeptidase-like regulatory domain-containing protein n=1 Tax=Streptomyces rimosus TaxID=1927 RepID=UPI0004C4E6AE|nr:carboxypeptidase-like regulatory domain-containing protein [Streptomyces rimosus]